MFIYLYGSGSKASAWNEGDLGSTPGKIPWRRKWQTILVFLRGKSHGWRSLVGYSSWGCKKSDTTKGLHSLLSQSFSVLEFFRELFFYTVSPVIFVITKNCTYMLVSVLSIPLSKEQPFHFSHKHLDSNFFKLIISENILILTEFELFYLLLLLAYSCVQFSFSFWSTCLKNPKTLY